MPRETPTPLVNKQFILQALKDGHRLDGRKPLERRETVISFADPSDGVAGLGKVELQMGKTRVLAKVSASLTDPRSDRPFEGILTITSEISPMAAEHFHGEGRATEEEVIITRLLEKAIRRSEAVDREALCVVAGEKVWHIRLHVHFLSSDGNMLDAGCFAGMTALRHFRRPEIERQDNGDWHVFSPDERAPIPLAIHHTPLCVSFAYLSGSAYVVDPTAEEASIAAGIMTLTLNAQRELCVLTKAGGTPLAVGDVMKVINVAIDVVKEMSRDIDDALKLDASARVVDII